MKVHYCQNGTFKVAHGVVVPRSPDLNARSAEPILLRMKTLPKDARMMLGVFKVVVQGEPGPSLGESGPGSHGRLLFLAFPLERVKDLLENKKKNLALLLSDARK